MCHSVYCVLGFHAQASFADGVENAWGGGRCGRGRRRKHSFGFWAFPPFSPEDPTDRDRSPRPSLKLHSGAFYTGYREVQHNLDRGESRLQSNSEPNRHVQGGTPLEFPHLNCRCTQYFHSWSPSNFNFYIIASFTLIQTI